MRGTTHQTISSWASIWRLVSTRWSCSMRVDSASRASRFRTPERDSTSSWSAARLVEPAENTVKCTLRSRPPGAEGAAAGPATPLGARADTCDRCSSRAPLVSGRSESGDTRSAGTAPPNDASRPAPGHPAPPAATGSPWSTAPPRARRTRGGRTDRVIGYTRPAAGSRVRLPLFSRDLLEDVDLQVAVRHHLLQAAVLLLELA